MPGFLLYQKMLSDYFADDALLLPVTAGKKNNRALLRSRGWTVRTVVYELSGVLVLEFYATHPTLADRHARFSPDGKVEELPVIRQLDPAHGMDQAKVDEIREFNQSLMPALHALGLL